MPLREVRILEIAFCLQGDLGSWGRPEAQALWERAQSAGSPAAAGKGRGSARARSVAPRLGARQPRVPGGPRDVARTPIEGEDGQLCAVRALA